MSLYSFFTPGFDPTSIPGTPSNSQLLQMVQEARPASGAGMFVWSAAAPDVVTYPDLAKAVWGKTTAGVPDGLFYYYDSTTWQPFKIEPGTLDGDSFAVGSIPVDRLEAGSPNTVLTTNGSGVIAWQSYNDILIDGSIAASKLAVAPDAGYMLISDTGGTWIQYSFATRFAAELAVSTVLYSHVTDGGGLASAGQVLYFPSTGAGASVQYADQLLRVGKVPTNVLQLSSANAGKTLIVNGTGTDIDYQSAAVGSVAILAYGGAAGTAPQTCNSGAERTINWTGALEQDPLSIVTLAANQITFASTGTYLIKVAVPIYPTGAGAAKGHVILKNVTDSTVLVAQPFYCYNGNGYATQCTLDYILTVSDIAKVYEARLYTSANVSLFTDNSAVNVTYTERYQQMVITKLS